MGIDFCDLAQALYVYPFIGSVNSSAGYTISTDGRDTPGDEHTTIAGRAASSHWWACPCDHFDGVGNGLSYGVLGIDCHGWYGEQVVKAIIGNRELAELACNQLLDFPG
jgi:hypothetical protein